MPLQSLSHLTEHGTAPHSGAEQQSSQTQRIERRAGFVLPGSRLGRWGRLLRLEMTLAICVPTLAGAAIAWWEQGEANFSLLILLLGVMLCGLMGIHVLGETNDYRYTLRPESKYLSRRSIAGSNLIAAGLISLPFAVALGSGGVLVAILGMLWLTSLVGWPVVFFTLLTLLVYSAYAVPPTFHGYLSWGVGEIGVFASLGLLNILNGYYAQAHSLTALPLWSSIPLGLFCVLVLHTQNFIYQRRDWMLRKRTFAVVLRDRRALDFSVLLTLMAFTTLLLLVVFLSLPPWALIGLLALPPTLKALTTVRKDNLSINSRIALHRTTSRAAIWVCLTIAFVLYFH